MSEAEKIEKTEVENVQKIVEKPLLKKWWIRSFFYFLIFGIVLQTFFYFLATPFLKEYIQNKVKRDSDGLYELYFEHLTLDFTGNNIFLTGFHLKPNKKRYKELLRKHKTNKALYDIELTALLIYDINIYESFTKPGISIENIEIVQPQIKIVDTPTKEKLDSTIIPEVHKKSKYDVFHQDLYPALSTYVKALNVQKISFSEGKFDFSLIENSNSISSAEKFSIELTKFSIDSISSRLKDRLFYSERINLKLENYSLYLKKIHHRLSIDSIRIITNKEIAIHNINLEPDTSQIKESDTLKSEIFANIKLFKFVKPNISDIYFREKINIKEVLIDSSSIQVTELFPSPKTTIHQNFVNINPFIFIEDYFKSINITDFSLDKSKINIHFLDKKKPNILIPLYSMKFTNFELDSSSYLKKDNFFYCKDFEFFGKDISAIIPNAYALNMGNLLLSTFQRKFTLNNFSLKKSNASNKKNNGVSLEVKFPFMSATGLDLKTLYNDKRLYLSNLILKNANLNINKYRLETFEPPELTNKKSFKFLSYISIANFDLENTNIQFNNYEDSILSEQVSFKISSHIANFKHNPSRKDTVLSSNFLDFSDFWLKTEAISFKSPKNDTEFSANTIFLSTFDSIVNLNNLKLNFDTAQNSLKQLIAHKKNNLLNLDIPSLLITGLQVKDFIYNRLLIFNTIKTNKPSIDFLSYSHLDFAKKLFKTKRLYKELAQTKDTGRQKLDEILAHFHDKNYHLKNYLSIYQTSFDFFESLSVKEEIINPKTGEIAQKKQAKLDSTQISKLISQSNLLKLVKQYFDTICFKELNIRNSKISFIQKDSTRHNRILSKNKTDIFIKNFQMNPFKIMHSYQHLFSDSLSIVLNKQELEIPNTFYKLRAGQLAFSFPDNSLSGKNVYVYEKQKMLKDLKIEKFFNFIVPEFWITGFDFPEFDRNRNLFFNKIYFRTPNISQIINLETPQTNQNDTIKNTKSISDFLQLKLPKDISSIRFTDFQIDTASFIIAQENKNHRNLTFNANISSNISEFLLSPLVLNKKIALFSSLYYFPSFENQEFDTISNYTNILNFWVQVNDLKQELNDSIHTLKIDEIRFSKDTTDIHIKNLSITPNLKKTNYEDLVLLQKDKLLKLNIPKIDIKNIDLHQCYYNSNFQIDSFLIKQTNADILRFPMVSNYLNKPKLDLNSLNIYSKIKPLLNQISINHFSLPHLNFISKNIDLSDTLLLSNASLFIDKILIDSLSRNSNKLFCNEDIRFTLPDFHHTLSPYYQIKLDTLKLSTQDKNLVIKRFVIKPRMSKEQFGKEKFFQTGMTDFAISEIKFNDFDIPKVINEKKIDISSIEIGASRLHVYKDLRLPVDSTRKPPMPLTLLYKSPYKIKIDSLRMKDMTLKYQERVRYSNEDSRILVDNINVSVLNLDNSPQAREAHDTTLMSVNGMVMGTGYFQSDFTFFIGSPLNQYNYNGFIKPFNLSNLNNYFTNSAFIRIPHGYLDRMKFNVIANDKHSYGRLYFNYHALKIQVLEKDENVNDSINTGNKGNRRAMLSLLANGLIKSSNPRYPGTPSRIGQIYFEPNPNKQIFNYWILSLLSGVKSTMGFNSRQARKIVKEEKENIKKMD